MPPLTAPLHTDEQARAITTREVSVALAAGAGCGKTYVLTQRLLEELSPRSGTPGQSARDRLNELVAITFTEAAARELRSRVRKAVAEAWHVAPPHEQPYWQEMLRHFDDCRISTIHSFCSDLVRRHAFELGLDPLMQVLDAAAARVLADEAIEDALRGLLADRDTDLMELATEWNIDGVHRRLALLLVDYRSSTFTKWRSADPQELVDSWRQYYEQDVWPAQLARIFSAAAAVEEALQRHPACGSEANIARLLDLLREMADGNCADPIVAEFGELANVRRVPLNKPRWQDDALYAEFLRRLNELRTELKGGGQASFDGPETRRAAELGICLTRVAAIAAEEYEQRKRIQGAIDFDDQLALAHRLLTEEAFREVQRDARRQIRLLMVDEFQDTDELQTEIVRALVGNVVESNRLFFVGDEKQSIYRFRKAEPKVFRMLRGQVPEPGRLPLSINFRSQPAILGFVNDLFGTAFGDGYQPLSAHLKQVTGEPCTELLWTEVSPEEADQADGSDESSPDRVNVKDCRRIEARTIAARLRQLFDGAEPIVCDRHAPGGCRPARYGDVAILFRALSDVQYYEEALRDAGIDYYLVGGHAFYSQQEVYDLLHLLRSVVSECDEISLAGVLRSPFFSLSDESLYWLVAEGGSLATGLFSAELPQSITDPDEQLRVVAARRILGELRRLKDTCTVSQLLEVAFERTGYDAALLAEFMGARKLANIQKLVEQARAAAASGVGKVGEFVTQLSKFVVEQPKEALAITSPEAADVVRLMTVHQAKGLEFPVVVVPDIARRQRAPFAQAVFSQKLGPLVRPESWSKAEPCGLDLYLRAEREEEAAESTRLFYVACTRAKDYLLLSSAVADWEKPCGWMATLGQTLDLRSGEPLSASHRPVRVTFDHEVPSPDRVKRQRHPSLARSLEGVIQRAALGDATSFDLAFPVGLDPQWIKRLSVTRLSGQLVATPDVEVSDSLSSSWAEEPRVGQHAGIDPIALGNLVHAVMERIDLASHDQVAEWCRIFAPQYDLPHADRLANEAERLLTSFLVGPRAASMVAARWIEREVEFNLSWPIGETAANARYLQGYVDCLYEDAEGKLRIVDYKTNQTSPEGVPQVARGYELQMLVYALAVEQSIGRGPDEMVLCFLRPGVEYAFVWNDETRQRAIALIDQAIGNFLRRPAMGRGVALQTTL